MIYFTKITFLITISCRDEEYQAPGRVFKPIDQIE